MTEDFTLVRLSPVRKIIAARMIEAKREIPHFRASVEIDVDALACLRASLLADHPPHPLSLNDLLVKACATALTDVPQVNVQWSTEGIRQFHTADISVIVAVEGGLSTPIIRSANTKSVWEVANEIRSLTARAARNELKMDDIVGGSFSISNLGMHGVDNFDAIINPPQCAILAIGAARPRLVVGPQNQQKIASTLSATLSVDHRAIDGVVAAAFLRALRKRIEDPHHLRP